MFRTFRSPSASHTPPWPPAIDLDTVRDTLLYMHDDMKRVPGLEKVAQAIESTLSEIEAAQRSAKPVRHAPIMARFLPSRR